MYLMSLRAERSNPTKRQKTKAKYRKENKWQPFVAGIIVGFILVAIIFALPLKTNSTETKETYYATEIKQEPYTVSEPYTTSKVYEQTKVFADGFYKVVPSGIVVPFYIDKPDARLTGKFENPIPGSFLVITAPNRIIWETFGSQGNIDLPLLPGQYRARFQENIMWGEDCYIYLAMKWTETQEVTEYREITKYREVPVQVEKQKTTLKQDRISIWKQIFSNKD
jgi:hypothetical protein